VSNLEKVIFLTRPIASQRGIKGNLDAMTMGEN
jgi:hypothetical protein